MDVQEFVSKLVVENDTKIILLVMDGLGGTPNLGGMTELEAASTPNLDTLAKASDLGLSIPVLPGITPGSGPGHLGIFGYDPIKYQIGRGILEALGVGITVSEKDVLARGNFATFDGEIVIDRRAGRPTTEENIKACQLINSKLRDIDGIEVQLFPGIGYIFVLKITGEDLGDELTDADPQRDGERMIYSSALSHKSQKTANIVKKFIKQVTTVLKDNGKINGCLLRGFSRYSLIPQFPQIYRIRSAAVATYPMYRGLAKLVGMDALEVSRRNDEFESLQAELKVLEDNYNKYDFFYFHVESTDSYAENSNFFAKMNVIEMVDRIIPQIMALKPAVLAVTGDHSTPSPISGHSWHTVPLLIHSKYSRYGLSDRFDEKSCATGSLGIIEAKHIMTLLMANAMRLKKYGA